VLDPLMSLLSDRIDTHRDANCSRGTRSAREDRRSYGGSDFLNRSLNKGFRSDISARITGSGAFRTSLVRSSIRSRYPESLMVGA